MSKVVFVSFSLVLACSLLATPATAGSFYVGADLGYAAYNMDDLNDEIEAMNNSAPGENIENINGGMEFGFFAGLALRPCLNVGLGYSRLLGSTRFSNPAGTLEYEVPAHVLALHAVYLPGKNRTTRLGAGLDLGLVQVDGSLTLERSGYGTEGGDAEGRDLLVAGYGVLDRRLGSTTSLFCQAGYRYAEIKKLDIDGRKAYTSRGDRYHLDYNGLFARVGLRLHL